MSLGTWLGRSQAFGVLASKCSSAQAECLRNIRDAAFCKLLGFTWEEFCSHYAGLTRPRVDTLIHNLAEFCPTVVGGARL